MASQVHRRRKDILKVASPIVFVNQVRMPLKSLSFFRACSFTMLRNNVIFCGAFRVAPIRCLPCVMVRAIAFAMDRSPVSASIFRAAPLVFVAVAAGVLLWLQAGDSVTAQSRNDNANEASTEPAAGPLEITDAKISSLGETAAVLSIKANGAAPTYAQEGEPENPGGESESALEASLEKELIVLVDGKPAEIVTDSVNAGPGGSIVLDVKFPLTANRGDEASTVQLQHRERSSAGFPFSVPPPSRALGGPGEQPLILAVQPAGGVIGDTITLIVRNAGANLDDVRVRIDSLRADARDAHDFKLITFVEPFYLSAGLNQAGDQELRFTIPPGDDLTNGALLSNRVSLQMNREGRKSNRMPLAVAQNDWRLKAVGVSIVIMVVMLLMISLSVPNLKYLQTLIVDGSTKTYSLSRCQALVWTIILGGSYIYLSIGTGLILGNGIIPEFNTSLLVLMGISYGGLIGSRGVSAKFPKKEANNKAVSFSNLYSEGGKISLPRLQLVVFTVIAVVVYLYILSTADIIRTGLPDVPATLLGLLGISQGGYLGDKVIGDRLSVNHLYPTAVPLNRAGQKLTLVGGGFSRDTKILFEVEDGETDGASTEPRAAEFLNPSSVAVELPAFASAGPKTIVVIPPSGPSVTLRGLLEVRGAANADAAPSEPQAPASG